MEIVKQFKQYIQDIPLQIIDIELVGSNASYNYTKNSDLDIHIIVNYQLITQDKENKQLLQYLYNNLRNSFRNNFDISIHDIQVEIYVQDVNSSTMSNGIYSVKKDEWIKFPKPIKAKAYDLSAQLKEWKSKLDKVIKSKDEQKIKDAIDEIYLLRKNSLETQGQYGKNNQLFKQLRNLDYIDKLKTALNKEISDRLTLQGYFCKNKIFF